MNYSLDHSMPATNLPTQPIPKTVFFAILKQVIADHEHNDFVVQRWYVLNDWDVLYSIVIYYCYFTNQITFNAFRVK